MSGHPSGTPARTAADARRLRLGASAIALLAALGGTALAPALPPSVPSAPTARPAGHPVAPAPAVDAATAAREAAEVAAESRRLIEVRSVSANAALHATQGGSPYRLATGSGYTLVLPQRATPYTVSDLLQLAPQTFLRLTDGSYLLLENLYVGRGATLDLATPQGLTLRMASTATGFVTIVSFDGTINLSGTAKHPMTVTSWDTQNGAADTDPTDGRAYIRSIGGHFSMSHVNVYDLGFWSGATGGISLTGSDRPTTGAATGSSTYVHVHEVHLHGKAKKDAGSTADGGTGTGTGAGTNVAQPSGNLGSGSVTTLPAGALNGTGSQYSVSGLSYVSAKITDSRVTGNAYGIFISSADGIEISDTDVSGSLIGGVVLHRFATNAVIDRVDSSSNHGDGFAIARAAQDVQIEDCTAAYNSGNGYTVNGQALSNGPSASGEPEGAYGNNTIDTSTTADNGHYGIEVLGGIKVDLTHDSVVGNTMGIVVRRGAKQVEVADDTLTAQEREGISLRDGDSSDTVTGNTVQGAVTGIYVRDSNAGITGNTVTGAQEHGITLVGGVAGSRVEGNTLTGSGPSPISDSRALGAVAVGHNTTGRWHDTTPMWTRVRRMARPMTLIWLGVFALIALAGLKGRSARRRNRHQAETPGGFIGRHPYQHQQPLPSRTAHELAPLVDDRALEAAL
ncbi:right-handed parallel beta-helix repeat-containing protein [Streptacidiphilus sp. PB12-B1b]|uniref:right-handed parallel beta-helix repeat-containing protein n=1 Tax=Streptacidiphilus sp. PB12-B1b TaxID=2705012 RepID=UPI0015FA3D71|nr:right-handed parallel beta-helix repeat-containing protein [Streptacidiphilus sp. PB12-B1b]QMU74552.1 right-handed parallel beta-helix repeat-containing protein [Streptacidiphilus sp. PB12-B1b]